MYCAFAGISSWSASSTARTEAMAWTVVQTPQKRCAKTQPSRGSRPLQNRLDAAPHGAARPCLLHAAAVDLDVDAQVTFDASYRVDSDAGHGVSPF